MKNLIKLDFGTAQFVTTVSNRKVNANRLVTNIKQNKGIDVPPIVFKANDFPESSDSFRDLLSGAPVKKEDITADTYIVADGQHRIAAAMNINKEADNLKKKTPRKDRDKIFNITSIDVLVYDREELRKRTLTDFIANINGTASNWKHGDYIDMAHSERKDDERANVIYELKNVGMSISTISRYLTFTLKGITNQKLVDYANGLDTVFFGINCKRGLQVLSILIDKGFGMNFLKKRYLIDYVIAENNAGRFDKCMNRLLQLTTEEREKIESCPPD